MEMGENAVLTCERSLPWGPEKSKTRKTKTLPSRCSASGGKKQKGQCHRTQDTGPHAAAEADAGPVSSGGGNDWEPEGFLKPTF